jgi:hypothetical protein
MDGVAAVQARISEIQRQFIAGAPARVQAQPAAGFAQALDAASATTGVGKPVNGTADQERFAKDVLAGLGMPVTAENLKAMVAWQRAEGTKAAYNPLATTQNWDGATKFNSVGVRNYASYQDGIAATIKTLRNGHYGPILDALSRGNSAEAVGRAVAASPWGTGEGLLRVLQKG